MLSTDFSLKDGVWEKEVQVKLQALVFEAHSSVLHQNLFQRTDRAAVSIILESYITYFTSPSGERQWKPLR